MKTQQQLNDYRRSNFTARIRANARLTKFTKQSVVNCLYKRLELGMSGLEFVEKFYGQKFEEHIMEIFKVSENNQDIDECSSESDSEDDEELSSGSETNSNEGTY